MSRFAFWVRVFCAVAMSIVLLSSTRDARAESPRVTVDLYTIGPSGDFPSRFGHSLLCVRTAGDEPENGRCYDYGVPSSEDMVRIGWEAVRNTPAFVPVRIQESVALAFFEGQGRKIERQRLPLTEQETEKLVATIEQDVREKRAYAYHPYWANCATKIRDVIDEASNGRLRPGPSLIPPGTLRDYMEEGHSGHIGILTLMALYLGEANERVPTPWEAMLLPSVLRDGVAERFSAPAEQVAPRVAVLVPTSRAVGRVGVVALAFVLFVAARVAIRRGNVRAALAIVGGTLGVFALSLEALSLVAKWPELSRSWTLLLFLPTDFALSFLEGVWRRRYVQLRIGMAAIFVVLEIFSVVDQPLLPLAVLVALPMSGLLSALKEREAAEVESAPPVWGAKEGG